MKVPCCPLAIPLPPWALTWGPARLRTGFVTSHPRIWVGSSTCPSLWLQRPGGRLSTLGLRAPCRLLIRWQPLGSRKLLSPERVPLFSTEAQPPGRVWAGAHPPSWVLSSGQRTRKPEWAGLAPRTKATSCPLCRLTCDAPDSGLWLTLQGCASLFPGVPWQVLSASPQ